MSRATVDADAVLRMVESGAAGRMESAARFMADEQRRATRSRRLASAVTHESGRDAAGWFARAGMSDAASRHGPAWFWYFEEFQTGRGGGVPFIRPSLQSNSSRIVRMMLRGR